MITNPPGDFDPREHGWIQTYREWGDPASLAGRGVTLVPMERVLWSNGDGVNFVYGYKCSECKILIFGSQWKDFRHECHTGRVTL